ncbi:MAG: DUF3658 domain-containing protein [Brachymonas sp.]
MSIHFQKHVVEEALLAQCSEEWRKLAMVVGMAMLEPPIKGSGKKDSELAGYVQNLVAQGKLQVQGDLSRMQHCEIRLV